MPRSTTRWRGSWPRRSAPELDPRSRGVSGASGPSAGARHRPRRRRSRRRRSTSATRNAPAREAGLTVDGPSAARDDVRRDELLALVGRLNADDGCDGILVQSPLPRGAGQGGRSSRSSTRSIRPRTSTAFIRTTSACSCRAGAIARAVHAVRRHRAARCASGSRSPAGAPSSSAAARSSASRWRCCCCSATRP